jgi:hypothetical protein
VPARLRVQLNCLLLHAVYNTWCLCVECAGDVCQPSSIGMCGSCRDVRSHSSCMRVQTAGRHTSRACPTLRCACPSCSTRVTCHPLLYGTCVPSSEQRLGGGAHSRVCCMVRCLFVGTVCGGGGGVGWAALTHTQSALCDIATTEQVAVARFPQLHRCG